MSIIKSILFRQPYESQCLALNKHLDHDNFYTTNNDDGQ